MKAVARKILDLGGDGMSLAEYDYVRLFTGGGVGDWVDVRVRDDGTVELLGECGVTITPIVPNHICIRLRER